MSLGEGASQNRIAPENKPIETCHQLLNARDFEGALFLAHMNQLVSRKRHDEFEKVRAICDVLIAAKPRFPMDYYGMIRVTPPGPVLLEDFKKLMKLLDGRHNRFPCSQEAAEEALVAWSLLSKPDVKAKYDLTLSKSGGGFVGKGKGKMESGLSNSFIPKKHNVGYGTDDDDDVVVVKSDDDDDDSQLWNLTIAQASKLWKVNGKRVNVVPSKKKDDDDDDDDDDGQWNMTIAQASKLCKVNGTRVKGVEEEAKLKTTV